MNVLSLFAGIGGIDLGLERIGCRTVAHSEIDLFASNIFARHFPDSEQLGIRVLGNSVVPQVAEHVGTILLERMGYVRQENE